MIIVQLIARMQQPDFYPHAVAGNIQVVQTQEQFSATKTYSDCFLTEKQDLFISKVKQNKMAYDHDS